MATAILLIFFSLPQEAILRRLLNEGDALYGKRAEGACCAEAIVTYKKALAIDSSNEEAYWKIARAYYWVGNHEKDNDKKTRIHKDAVEYAKLAVALNEQSLPGHFWLGVHYVLYGEARGMGQSLYLVEPALKEMEWVLKKDETFMDGGAHRVLGIVYFRLPGIAGGDNDKAIKHLKRSIEIAPTNPDTYNFLAEVYLSQGKEEEAIKALKKALIEGPPSEHDPDFREERERARKKLKELGE